MAEFQPKVSSHVDEGTGAKIDAVNFDDSSVVIKLLPQGLFRSEDNGQSWENVKLPVKDANFTVSEIHTDTNYLSSTAYLRVSENMFVTKDQGKSWKQLKFEGLKDGLKFDNDEGGFFSFFEVFSHPYKESLNVVNVHSFAIVNGEMVGIERSFASNDGVNFKEMTFDDDEDKKKENDNKEGNTGAHKSGISCSFLQSSKDSKLTQFGEKLICKKVYYEDLFSGLQLESKVYLVESNLKTISPLAKNLNGKTVGRVYNLDSHLYITILDDKFNTDSPVKVLKLREGTVDEFKEIPLPTQVRNSFFTAQEVDGRVILSIYHREEDKSEGEAPPGMGFFKMTAEVLISDSYGENFRMLDLNESSMGSFSLSTSLFVKKTMFATWSPAVFSTNKMIFQSKASFDLGKTWKKLKVVNPENKWEYPCDINDDSNDCGLQIMSMSRNDWFNEAETFTPGIISAVGAVFDGTGGVPFSKMGTFISRDNGLSWEQIFSFPCHVAMGDYGNIVVAYPYDPEADEDEFSEFYYSLDQGKTFQEYQFETKFFPRRILQSAMDGSGSSFLIMGDIFEDNYTIKDSISYTIDFSEAFEGSKCKEDDLEDWYFADGQCIDGVKIKFNRRKQDAKCLIKTEYKDISFQEEVCECSDSDYECSNEFTQDSDGRCIADFSKQSLLEKCENVKDSIKMSPKRKSKTTKCKNDLPIEEQEVHCSAALMPSKLKVSENKFSAAFKSYQYFDTFSQESILVRTDKNEVYASHDGGAHFRKVETDGEDILEINFNPFFNTSAYLFGKNKNLYSTADRAVTFSTTKLPEGRQLGFPLSFHAKDPKTFIYYGGENCDSFFDPKCHAVAYITKDGGQSFDRLLEGALSCEFIESAVSNPRVENGITCLVKDKSSGKRNFVTSSDYFKTQTVLYPDALGFMTTGDYLVVAVPHGERQLRAYFTVDGVDYSEAILPKDLESYEQKAFTILGSQEGAIFMHMTTNLHKNQEFGALLKSNTEGTSFVILERAVNRNYLGFVDFEKIQGIEGIILVNVVSNVAEIVDSDNAQTEKKIKTKITFNDGADWTYIKPPSVDSEGKKFKCNPKNLEKCSLNLHGFTERKDVRDTYSSRSALGYMFALGNVGEYLMPRNEASTFLTKDGGVTWTEVKKGAYQWEYGDHGSVLVLVKDDEPTDTISYSLDGGSSWNEYKFTTDKILVSDLVTVPQDSAMRFLLIGTTVNVHGKETKTYTVDFTDTFKRQCEFSKDNLKDFEYISLSHPKSNECLFGHKAQYLRKTSKDCYIGMAPLKESFNIITNCSCTRNDYECDYNYRRVSDGTCKLIDGTSPADPEDICKKDNNLIEYFEPTGYRKVPLSTCNGGLRLDNSDNPRPCPGKEKEFKDKYNVNHAHFFGVWIITVLFVSTFLTFIYYRGIKRNGGFSRFGEIRLGDDDLIEENNTDRFVNSVVRNGVFLFSSVYSGLQYLGHETGNFFKRSLGRFGNRSAPSYQSLLHDQFIDDADDLLVGHDEDADDLASFIENDDNFDIGNDDDDEIDMSSETPTHAPYSDNPEGGTPDNPI
ncbi:vacuolar protein sorting/targeting protein PEP1 [Kluyveromyces marxianus DMKU3-1042]|uniref:Vacuolar protein sorting/targeting protein PEP1 n=1 Tax=Kluyveromyces marxianus (strain DMKU3-1042 / BCC 29191 / NBRC 104275) TaxID=1003335 RepID=W0T614_KLUMD|nr:vacuolar protein sorting/targeting protein PEP1 [Kluyveromyces marxianus DMKU3-1042]BAO38498.1 vacuolar protein sorting/targeting protein PEP1 [Kluyveromyces marxianus DMKU3-1042]